MPQMLQTHAQMNGSVFGKYIVSLSDSFFRDPWTLLSRIITSHFHEHTYPRICIMGTKKRGLFYYLTISDTDEPK